MYPVCMFPFRGFLLFTLQGEHQVLFWIQETVFHTQYLSMKVTLSPMLSKEFI